MFSREGIDLNKASEWLKDSIVIRVIKNYWILTLSILFTFLAYDNTIIKENNVLDWISLIMISLVVPGLNLWFIYKEILNKYWGILLSWAIGFSTTYNSIFVYEFGLTTGFAFLLCLVIPAIIFYFGLHSRSEDYTIELETEVNKKLAKQTWIVFFISLGIHFLKMITWDEIGNLFLGVVFSPIYAGLYYSLMKSYHLIDKKYQFSTLKRGIMLFLIMGVIGFIGFCVLVFEFIAFMLVNWN